MTTAIETTAATIAATSAITSLVGTRYWPNHRQNETLPAITYEVISEIRNDWIEGPGVGKRCRVQLDCWAETRTSADALADSVETALSATGRVLYRRGSYDHEVEIYRVQLDWSVGILNP